MMQLFLKERRETDDKPWDGSTTFITKKRICGKIFTQINRLCTVFILYGERMKSLLDTAVILSGFASLLYHG